MRKMKTKKTIVVITGPPGTGKSHWAKGIQQSFADVHIFAYDDCKEEFYDRFGLSSREEKAELDARALEAFYRRVEAAMEEGETLVIEYPFNQRHRPRLAEMIERQDYRVITLYLYGDMETLYWRGQHRDGAGRHPGHLVNVYHKGITPIPTEAAPDVRLSLRAFLEDCGRKDYDIQLGETISVDVTDLEQVNAIWEETLDAIAALS